ncbi:MAG: hypothetical protein ACPGJV_13985 [Bacteriovoracaceae bacterium]
MASCFWQSFSRSFFVPEGTLLSAGLIPFIPGMIVKTILASLMTPALRKTFEKIELRF